MLNINECKSIDEALQHNWVSNPAKTFIIYKAQTLTYGDVYQLVNGLSAFLRASGVKKDDKVCMVLPRVPELIITFLAAARIGALVVPVNFTLGKIETASFIRSVKPAATVIHEKLLSSVDLDCLATACKTVIIAEIAEKKRSHPANFIPWHSACCPSNNVTAAEAQPLAYLNYTTGSTSTPKGALATHENIYVNTASAVNAMGFTADDVHLCMFSSFAHPHELFVRALYTGASIALLEEINPKTMAAAICSAKVTAMMGIAPLYDMLSSHANNIKLDTLRIAESGGMYTRPDVSERFFNTFGIPILSVWGSTETTGIAIANTPSFYRMDGSMGRPCPYYEVKVVDEDGRETQTGQTGELLFRGNAVISGYIEGSEFPLTGGWYQSGDLGWRDSEGFFYFTDRKSGLLKVAGLKVYPLQVELCLLEHPAIKEAAVIGIEDKLRGDIPAAFVVLKENDTVTVDEILRYCNKNMAHYMIPRKMKIVEELPKIGSGKIDKKQLKQAAAKILSQVDLR
ncbi:class I adenylate-forming enzyme family protein [Candidatus Magnetominusculus xianensis]|uniref:Long-chain fatty acid--CoA ligase n=1 Tax=Candidatus Magnetominusculus xianensis TaxID=1748249 RepID=A0ABR5SD71_9BACT|nr:class I adenylate-forming enzyme family protein [Candidatus Magnetominusculus xianensis]KWT78182.1 long-chain fatty acid--CoA ligase [Candidatus Magnetominusculus xianensis]MBF0404681.1 acyl--CoA ligase [Nitrospirota bacterium]